MMFAVVSTGGDDDKLSGDNIHYIYCAHNSLTLTVTFSSTLARPSQTSWTPEQPEIVTTGI